MRGRMIHEELQRWLSAVLFLLALLFLLAFRRYNLWDMTEGWVISDEGHQLYQPLRWMAGQWYYRDFSTDNYPPGTPVLHATLFRWFGVRMSVIRTFLSLVGAGIAALAFVIARQIMSAGWALIAYFLCLSWNVLNLNIGYPSWYCTVLGLLAVWATCRYIRYGAAGWLVLAGVLTGLSAVFKLTQGAYQWMGIALCLAWRSAASRPEQGWRRRLLSWESALAILSLALALFLLRSYPTFMNALLFGVPLVLVSAAVITCRPRCEQSSSRHFLWELLWLGLGAMAVTLAWAIPTIMVLGWDVFVEGTFLAPLRHSAFIHAEVRPPTLNGWLLLVWAAGGAVWLWRSRWPWPAWLAYSVLGMSLLCLPFGAGWNPREIVRTAFQTWRGLRFFLFLLVSLGIWWALWKRRAVVGSQALLVLLLSYGSWNFMQVYPFADSNHLIWSIQPAFVGLAYLMDQAVAPRPQRKASLSMGLVPAFLIALQFYPLLGHFYSLESGIRPVVYELLEPKRADVYVRQDAAQTIRAVGEAIIARTSETDTIFDTSGSFFYFLTGRHNPTRHDFLWPGFLSEEEIAQLLRDLEARRPALVIRRETDEHVQGYASFAETFPAIAEFIGSRYRLDARIGEYALWVRR